MILLSVDCAYPGTDLAPTSVTIQPIGLGDESRAAEAAFARLLGQGEYFEVEATGEPWSLPFYPEMVRRFAASEVAGDGTGVIHSDVDLSKTHLNHHAPSGYHPACK